MAVDESQSQTLARTFLRPSLQAASTAEYFNSFRAAERQDGTKAFEVNPADLVDALAEQCRLVNEGNLSRVEAMLVAQAHTLDAMFNFLAKRAAVNMSQYPKAFALYLPLAMKAQSQCRTTIEALAELKNPRPVAFVRQANIANGPQQVNNARAGQEGRTSPDELLEDRDGKRLDTPAPPAPGIAHSPLETVAPLDRADVGCREGARLEERVQGERAGDAARDGSRAEAAAS